MIFLFNENADYTSKFDGVILVNEKSWLLVKDTGI